MGEMADYYIEVGIEQLCKDDLDLRDHGKFKPDDEDEDEGHAGYVLRSKIRSCNKCGEKNLHWESADGKWRLFYPDGTIHNCFNKSVTEHVSSTKNEKTDKPLINKITLGKRNKNTDNEENKKIDNEDGTIIYSWFQLKELIKQSVDKDHYIDVTTTTIKSGKFDNVLVWVIKIKTKKSAIQQEKLEK
jgi:hypothetical protein